MPSVQLAAIHRLAGTLTVAQQAARRRTDYAAPAWALLMLVALTPPPLAADGPPQSTRPPLTSSLTQPVSFAMRDVPLRQLLEQFDQTYQVATLLDRRIDPLQTVELAARNQPLGQALEQLARSIQAQVCPVETTLYIGPEHTAGRLATQVAILRQSAERLSPAARARWLAKRPLQWDELARPAELIQQLEEQLERPIQLSEQVVHDLWPGGQLPDLTLVARLSLVLAGFDASFEIQPDGSARVVPMPPRPQLTRRYPLPAARRGAVESLRQSFPQAQLSWRRGELTATGSIELHEQIEQLMQPTRAAPATRRPEPRGAQKLYQLQVRQQTIAAIVQQIETSLGLQFQVPPELTSRLQQRVSLDIQDATLDQLLGHLFGAADLAFERQGNVVRVVGGER